MQDGLAANSVDGLHPTKAYNATLAVGYQDAITADFNTAIGIVWDGATSSGQLLTPIDAGPTTLTHASYTDGDGNVWNLYRQERLLTTEQVWVE
jgi:hypothetical protein